MSSQTANEKNKSPLVLGIVGIVVVGLLAVFYGLQMYSNSIPEQLVGRWRVVEGQGVNDIYNFRNDGNFEGTFYVDGRKGTQKSIVTVNGDLMKFATKNPITGEVKTRDHTIVKISDAELILEQKGDRSVLRRE